MSEAVGVVLLSKDAHQRLIQAAATQRTPSIVAVNNSETQTEQDYPRTHHDTPAQLNTPVQSSSQPIDQGDYLQNILDSVPKYFRPSCQEILNVLTYISINNETGFITAPGSPIDGLSIQKLLFSTCVPFSPPVNENVAKYFKSLGIAKFRNHLSNISPPPPKGWISPYTF